MRLTTLIVATMLSLAGIADICRADGTPAPSATDLGVVIEQFVHQRFPASTEHFWVINEATREEDEVTVDVSTVVHVPSGQGLVAERYLLLIVKGTVAAAQLIPSAGDADCKPEEA